MKTFSYSPSVEAYVKVGKGGSVKDLSADITACTVNRVSDAVSEFSITLQNKDWKYNGLFQPFDPIVIYATKISKVKLFSGFVNSFDAFQLYQGDFHLSGYCSIYKLQQYYWDPLLLESQLLLRGDTYNATRNGDSYNELITNLLTKVAGWPADGIILGEMPDEAFEFAKEMYQANMDSAQQLYDRTNEFFEVLKTHGPQLSGVTGATRSSGGSGVYSAEDSKASPDQKKIAEVAENFQNYGIVPEANMCGAWVSNVYQAAGFPRPGGNAVDFWNTWKDTGSSDTHTAPLGCVLVGSGTGDAGATYGHVGIRITGGRVASCVSSGVNGVRINSTIDEFFDWQTATCQGTTGAFGWVIPPGPTFAKESVGKASSSKKGTQLT